MRNSITVSRLLIAYSRGSRVLSSIMISAVILLPAINHAGTSTDRPDSSSPSVLLRVLHRTAALACWSFFAMPRWL
jgi:hypothetical protein